MPRIRTIKPEFPQSESMGRVSRDARLLFILLWTIADDEGRLRGSSRILASLLFPYDDDANGLMDAWLQELEREECIVRYMVDRDTYLQILNWDKHQKIDRPSGSKIPSFDGSSRILARGSRDLVVGPRTKDQGPKDQRTKIAKRVPAWMGKHDPEVVEATQEIMSFYPDQSRKQPDGKPIPKSSGPELADRLSRIKKTGASLTICIAIAKRYVDEFEKGGKWIKAAQNFFGLSEDAPFKAYYQAHLTNEEVPDAS